MTPLTIQNVNLQKGYTVTEWTIIAFYLILTTIIAVKIVPKYSQDTLVAERVLEIEKYPHLDDMSDEELYQAFADRARIDDIHAVKPEHFKVNREAGLMTINIDYTVIFNNFFKSSLG